MRNEDQRYDMFVAKYEPSGTLAWVRTAGGPQWETAADVEALSDGSVVVAGGVGTESAVLGAGEPNEVTLHQGAMYLARYAADGEMRWVVSSGDGRGSVDAVEAGPGGFLYVTGTVQGEAVFGQGEAIRVAAQDFGDPATYVARYTTGGELSWIRFVGGGQSDWASALSVGGDGTLWATGRSTGALTFSAGQPDESVSDYTSDQYGVYSYAVQYSASGELLGHLGIPDSGSNSAAATSDGGALVAGRFGEETQQTTLPNGSGQPTTLTTHASFDGFLARYDANRSLLWVEAISGDAGPREIIQVAVATDDTIFVTGYFSLTVVFGAGDTNETRLSASEADGSEIFVAKYRADGALEWVEQIGGAGNQQANGITVLDSVWFLTASSDQGGPLVLGAGEPNETSLPSAGGYDAFLAMFAR
ncbi:MAG: hypothetical protein JW751_03225 [Polyangiaceae bacterium]|nr:hypothetical protein [Polyangiaceae bacterium]